VYKYKLQEVISNGRIKDEQNARDGKSYSGRRAPRETNDPRNRAPNTRRALAHPPMPNPAQPWQTTTEEFLISPDKVGGIFPRASSILIFIYSCYWKRRPEPQKLATKVPSVARAGSKRHGPGRRRQSSQDHWKQHANKWNANGHLHDTSAERRKDCGETGAWRTSQERVPRPARSCRSDYWKEGRNYYTITGRNSYKVQSLHLFFYSRTISEFNLNQKSLTQRREDATLQDRWKECSARSRSSCPFAAKR
jgi:hypothetical protein